MLFAIGLAMGKSVKGNGTCLFHFSSGHCMVEFVDTNVHAVLAPKHSVLIAF
jgi:hypothetical protein